MTSGKKSRCLLLLLLLSTRLLAQEKHTLYYSNGEKALEGRWTYVGSTFQKTSLTDAAMAGMDGRADFTEAGPETNRSGNLPWIGNKLVTQHLHFEGPVTAYYRNGSKQSEIRYRKGIATGRCTTYYSNGSRGWQGELLNGMRTGEWTGWYRDGTLYCKGWFQLLKQEQLQFAWQTALDSGRIDRWGGRFSDLLSGQYSDSSKATDFWRLHFNSFEGQLEGARDASLVFFQKNGDSLATVAFKNGLRDGRWKYWFPEGQLPPVELEYREGRLLSVDEGAGRLTIGQFVADYQQRVKASAAEADPGLRPATVESPTVFKPVTPRNVRLSQAENRMPVFTDPAGLPRWIDSHIRYPASALRDSTYGYVTVMLLLSEAGKRTDAFIQTSSGHAGLDAEALRVVQSLPDFLPATSNGKKVRSSLSIPVYFAFPKQPD